MTTKKLYNAGTIFLGYWALITFLSSLNLDNASPIRQESYALILLGLISFAAGCVVCKVFKHKPVVRSEYNFEISDYRLLNLACIVIIVYSIYRFGIIASYLSQGISWGDIRLMHGYAGESGIYHAAIAFGGGYPTILVKRRYRIRFGRSLDFDNPSNFNEKILWLEKNWQHPLIVQCSDKYRLHEYVRGLGLERIMPKIYGKWDHAEDIDWDSLPDQFVIKCNHGAKWNIICTNKAGLNRNESESKLNSWLKMDYGLREFEVHYSHIKPVIFAEEYIEPNSDKLMPDDYKIYCFNGKPKFLLVCLERESELELEWYDFDWNIYDIGAKPNKGKAKRPKSLEKMIEYAEKLSQPFPFVRVDFYDRSGEAVLGEMTFSPMYGMAKYYSEEGNKQIGDMLLLPQKYKGRFE